ncbi:MAG: proline dehydrogenase [Bacteroidetes bacterium]|nr:proline dehydrogenase [Bacteroidota bacterium]
MKLPFIFAKRFVAGETFEQTIAKVKDLNYKKIKVSLDLLGENVKDRKIADETVAAYIDLVKGIEENGLDATISIKLTMLGLDIDRDYCRDNLFKLLSVAKANKRFVRIDMEGSPYTQVSVVMYKEALAKFGSKVVGLVLQAYLKRTEVDVNELAKLGGDIRICKGAYKEPAEIAIKEMPEIRKAYLRYAKHLIDNTAYPRIATHDDELIDAVLAYTKEKNISKDRFEFQMLYGLRQNTCEKLAAEGYNVRVYVPYGTMWLPYFTRRLAERKENIFFVLTAMFKG